MKQIGFCSSGKIHPLRLFMLFSPFLCGGFYEWISCLFSLFLTAYLLYYCRKTGGLSIYINTTLFSVSAIILFYVFSAIWAVDKGMAILGFGKFVPVLLFTVVLMQVEPQERESLLDVVPLSGGIMTILSFVLGQIPMLRESFFVNARLGGFFQYPNAFALFLLAGVIILVGKEYWSVRQFLCLVILLSGIALSGSRTTFLILTVVVLAIFILQKKRKNRWILFFLMILMVVITVIYAMLTGNVSNIGRYLTISMESSTFLGRLLYFKDALPVILKHPLGLGYMGYHYTQGSFQTGVYSVMNIHNELMQICLDIGWIPAIISIVAIIKSVVSKKNTLTRRLLLFSIVGHCMFDFDMQFISVAFILLLTMDLDSGHIRTFRNKKIVRLTGWLMAIYCIWMGYWSGLYRWGKYEMAVKVYPGCTDAWIAMLPQATNRDEMEYIADEIMSRNQSVALAYSAKARIAYTDGDFESMISYKLKAISDSKYELDEYLDYFEMLYIGIQLYEANGDMESAEHCKRRLAEIPDMLDAVLDETDELAWKIADQPELALPDEYKKILDMMSSY